MRSKDIQVVEGGVYRCGRDAGRIRIVRIVPDPRYPMVEYERLPIEAPEPMMRRMGLGESQMLIRAGSETRRSNLISLQKNSGIRADATGWPQNEITEMEAVLDGEQPPILSRLQCADLTAHVQPKPGFEGDPWRLIDHLTGGCCNGAMQDQETGTRIYECTLSSLGETSIRAVLEHPDLTVIRVQWGEQDVLDDLRTMLADRDTNTPERPRSKGPG